LRAITGLTKGALYRARRKQHSGGVRAQSSGWTGGQYSVWRGLVGCVSFALWLGLALRTNGSAQAWLFRMLGGPADAVLRSRLTSGIEVVALLAALAFALGWRARAQALVLSACFVALAPPADAVPPALLAATAWLVHALVPPAPYGSLCAVARVDPRGDWRMPRAVPWLARAALAGLVVQSVLRAQPGDVLALCLLLPGALAPAWIPAAGGAASERLFYDGSCGLCQRFVRFVVAEDARGTAFRFAPLGGATFQAAVDAPRREGLPDSIVVLTDSGELLVRSRAARHALARLGGLWRAVALLTAPLPAPLADLVYDAIARVRHRLFARPSDACPLLPPDLRARFDP
jgi:predicted DCC family thiol-disulfide oxidoreductase YuxK